MVVYEVLSAAGDTGLPAPDRPDLLGRVEAVAGAGLRHFSLQQPLVGRVQAGHQALRLVFEVVREAPVSLPGEGSGVRVGVRDAFLDGFLDDGDVFLQGVGGPGVEHDVQELADVTSDLLGLAGRLLTNDGDEPEHHRVNLTELGQCLGWAHLGLKVF